jgi:hypothetical protein
MLSKMEPRAMNILRRLRQKIEEREGESTVTTDLF